MIRLAYRTPYNSGFHYTTEIEKCTRNDTALQSHKISLYPTWTNSDYFYETFVTDMFWKDCANHTTDS